MSVCPHDNSETNDPDVFRFGVGTGEWSWDVIQASDRPPTVSAHALYHVICDLSGGENITLIVTFEILNPHLSIHCTTPITTKCIGQHPHFSDFWSKFFLSPYPVIVQYNYSSFCDVVQIGLLNCCLCNILYSEIEKKNLVSVVSLQHHTVSHTWRACSHAIMLRSGLGCN